MFRASSLNAATLEVLLLMATALSLGNCQSPPRLLPEAFDLERVVPEGTNVQLPCPVEGDPDTLFFEWYRDKEHLDTFGEERYRVATSGILRIKAAIPEDTGLYVCRAVNGFGSVDVKVTLLVLGTPDPLQPTADDEEVSDSSEEFTNHDQSDSDISHQVKPEEISDKGKPRLTHVSKFHGSIIQRLVGTSITLKCVATADPRPQVSWLKNGKPLPDGNLPSSSRKGRWTLHLQNLQASDTGNYTCLVYNGMGSVSASFLLRVTDGARSSPQMIGTHPANTTVFEGDMALLQCLVRSDVPPHVQWLKEVREDHLEAETPHHNTIKVQGDYFRVLKSSEVVERSDGSYLNKLVISSAHQGDAGKYICMGANKMGYTFRSAFLTILPKPRDEQSEESNASTTGLAFPLVLAVAVSAAVIVATAVGLCVRCRGGRSQRPTTPSSRATSSSKASVSTETKNSYACMAYNPHLGIVDGHIATTGVTLPNSRMYVPTSHMLRVDPVNTVFV